MDSVRFGRALGIGVREAAKAAVKAAEAAAAPDPAGGGTKAAAPGERVRVQDAMRQTAQSTVTSTAGLREGSRRFGRAAIAPVAKAGGVLWHEVMGVLFGLFVLVAAEEAWRGRGALVQGAGRTHEWLALGMLVVFGFFTGSSFLKARRRGQR